MSKRKSLVKTLDKNFSVFIRLRDGKCVICGSTERLTCGHLFSRIDYSTRWDELNCACQCLSCNQSHEWDAYPFTSWFLRKYGQETYDKLHLKYATPRKFKDWDLEELIEKYKILK